MKFLPHLLQRLAFVHFGIVQNEQKASAALLADLTSGSMTKTNKTRIIDAQTTFVFNVNFSGQVTRLRHGCTELLTHY